MHSLPNLEPVCCSCPVLTVASWPAYRFLRRQVRWSGIPTFLRIFNLLWSTQSQKATKSLELSRTFKLRDPQQSCPSGSFCLWPRRPVTGWCCGFTWLLASVVTALEVLRFTLHEARGLHRAYMLYKRQQTWFPMASTKSREALESPVIVFEQTGMRKRVARGIFWNFQVLKAKAQLTTAWKTRNSGYFQPARFVYFSTQ